MAQTEAHRLPRVVLNERRRRAVKLCLSGATIAETVSQCELGRTAVIRAMQAYESDGRKAVAVPIVGRPTGSGRQLTAAQEQKIQQLIADHLYFRDVIEEVRDPELPPGTGLSSCRNWSTWK
jgi:transposase